MKRPYFYTIVLLSLFLSLTMVAQSAQAAWGRCRSDPIIHLSNGQRLSLSASIGVPLQDVEEIHYTLHVPADINLVRVVGTPNWPTTIETFTFVQDGAPGEYHIEAIVHTSEDNVPVTANVRIMGVSDSIYDSVNGFEDQILHLFLNIP